MGHSEAAVHAAATQDCFYMLKKRFWNISGSTQVELAKRGPPTAPRIVPQATPRGLASTVANGGTAVTCAYMRDMRDVHTRRSQNPAFVHNRGGQPPQAGFAGRFEEQLVVRASPKQPLNTQKWFKYVF